MAIPSPPVGGTKRDRTKAALIAAFWDLVDEGGFAAASLEAVARRAGMTRGAIYSNFASRAELLLAAAAVRGLKIDRDFSQPGTLAEQLDRFAQGLVLALPNAPGTQRWHAELLLHIATEPALKAQVAQGFTALFEVMAAQLQAQHGDELAIPAASLALAIQALTMGLIYQAIISPDAVTPAAVFEAYAALARGAVRQVEG
ncbi:AcrR family transcriptional regulator [Caulobacter ginsengisoli]|uniref:AcrR family transcriptional regulator n=1 Tax=Caulobacter ginsengisoli TaxID=400775 RepID=A0ABU0IQ67_9CAUL|nr:TetR/AcrR family transcriptional regulator [Caulobacter ginsengisoli]MDQ0464155.1 AcrR family transcriptional regulator [Caulobacter ginsengisoli]